MKTKEGHMNERHATLCTNQVQTNFGEYELVNETLWSETETFSFLFETRPRPSQIFARPRRSKNTSRDRDVETQAITSLLQI